MLPPSPPHSPERHSLLEDAQALLVGSLFVAFAVVLFRHAGLVTGGTAGLAFLIHYFTGWAFGPVFFVVNLPFYLFAYRALGWRFTLKTFIAIALLSLFSETLPQVIEIGQLQPAFAAILAGLMSGVGILMLVRHKSSLGGFGVLAIYLQERHGLRAGKVQMVADCLVVLGALFVREPMTVALSVLGAVALNLIIAVNHKPGRYVGI